LRGAGIGVLVRGAVARGLLIDKPATAYLNYNVEEVGRMAAAVKDIHGRSTAQTAIRYVLDHPAVAGVVVGIRTMEQLEEAVGAVVADPLTERERRLLEGALPANRYEEHR
jgi:aryl-alcohol dehydrogenase-like predicted oxidoreductase